MAETKTAVILMPTYNDWESITQLLPRIDEQLAAADIRGEVVIIDDGSSDFTGLDAVAALRLARIGPIEHVALHRNVGNQKALSVGIAYCADNKSGDFLILMDSDQEDDPRYIPDLIARCVAENESKIIFAERTKRSEGILFSVLYGAYRSLYRLLTGLSITIGNYSVVPWPVVERLAHVGELWSHYPAATMRARIPFATIPSTRAKREIGESKMNIVSLVLHALSGFSVHAEVVGARALIAAAIGGVLVVAIAMGLVLIRLFTDIPIVGWTSQAVGLLAILVFQLLIGAVLMSFMVITVRLQLPATPMAVYKSFLASVTALSERG